MIFDIALAVVLFALCIYALVSDLKTGIIRNVVLIVFGSLLLVITAIKFLFWDRNDFWIYLENIGVFVLIGIIGYITRIWAGGDCKLLAVIALSFPTMFYFDYNQIKLTLWLIIVFAFVFSFIWLLIDSIVKTAKEKNKFDYKKMLCILKNYLLLYVKSFLFLTLFNQIYTLFVFPFLQLNTIIYFLISFLLVVIVSKIKILGNIWVLICVAAVSLAFMVISKNFVIVIYWKNYLLILLFMIFRSFMSLYNYKTINTSDVVSGMVLSKVDTVLMNKSKVKGLPCISDESLKSRLTEDEASSVRRWEKSKYGKPQVSIVRKIPFATFISIGTIIYLTVGVLQFCDLI